MKTYLFADMEFSGLDCKINRPLEIAIIATDSSLKVIKTYSSVFYWEDIVFNDWSERTHLSSGLINEIQDGKSSNVIDKDLLRFTEDLPGDLVIAGNSVYVDRSWISEYLPCFAKKLNHRMLDLTSIDMMLEGLGIKPISQRSEHRAMPDARAALKNARHYFKNVVYSASLDGKGFESRNLI